MDSLILLTPNRLSADPAIMDTQDSLAMDIQEEKPRARYPWGTYLTMAVLGLTSLTPWNTVVTAYDFFHGKFNETGSRTVEVNFPSYFQIGGISSDLVVSLACLALLKPGMLKRAITTSNVICLAFFVGFTVLAKVDTSAWAWGYLALSNITFCLVEWPVCQ